VEIKTEREDTILRCFSQRIFLWLFRLFGELLFSYRHEVVDRQLAHGSDGQGEAEDGEQSIEECRAMMWAHEIEAVRQGGDAAPIQRPASHAGWERVSWRNSHVCFT
jgi:hypothetical protein